MPPRRKPECGRPGSPTCPGVVRQWRLGRYVRCLHGDGRGTCLRPLCENARMHGAATNRSVVARTPDALRILAAEQPDADEYLVPTKCFFPHPVCQRCFASVHLRRRRRRRFYQQRRRSVRGADARPRRRRSVHHGLRASGARRVLHRAGFKGGDKWIDGKFACFEVDPALEITPEQQQRICPR